MHIIEETATAMMTQYFTLEASKATPTIWLTKSAQSRSIDKTFYSVIKINNICLQSSDKLKTLQQTNLQMTRI